MRMLCRPITMGNINQRAFPETEFNYALLHRLAELAPGAIFQLEVWPDGQMRFNFISRGIEKIHPDLNPELLVDNPRLGFATIHPDDLQHARMSMHQASLSMSEWRAEYRVVESDGRIIWHSVRAIPERTAYGSIMWYGTFQDISESKEYTAVLEQILFDISHVIRRPASSILGILNLLRQEPAVQASAGANELLGMLQSASEELDQYIHQLNQAYHSKRSLKAGI